MTLFGYRLNGRALLARVVYRWRMQALIILLALLVGCGLTVGLIPPLWRGTAQLEVEAPPAAVITVDGYAWPFTLYAGRHTVAAELPDGRRSWATVDLQAGRPVTLTLPAALPAPRVRPIPPAAPGTDISWIGWADGAWRVQSTVMPEATQDARQGRSNGSGGPPVAAQTVAITAAGLEPLPTLDAYGGRADQVHVNGVRYEAVSRVDSLSQRGQGLLEIRGWDDPPQTVALSGTLTLVRWAPTGEALLIGEQIGAEAEQLRLLRRNGASDAVLAVPGRVRDVIWSADGSGVVLASQHATRVTLTLVRLQPTIAARVIAEVQATDEVQGSRRTSDRDVGQTRSAALPPLHWAGRTLEWIGPDAHGTARLWAATLTSLMPERKQALAAAALTRSADGTPRVVAVLDGQVVIGLVQADALIVEAVIPDVPAAADLVGQWSPRGDQIVLRSGPRAWLVDLAAPESSDAAH